MGRTMRPGSPRACEAVDCLLPMTIVLDSDKQVGEDWAGAQSLQGHDLLAATLPGNGSQAPGRLENPTILWGAFVFQGC